MRIALGVEYDGSGFCGWQSQLNVPTVQDALQQALSAVAGEQINVIAAGRTDTGVHGIEQVVHFDTEIDRPLTAWVRGANALLPAGVAVLWAQQVSDLFHARFSAHGRSYRYLLLNRPVRSALCQGKVGWFHQPLALEQMQLAARYLLGEHDFSAFRAAECQAKSPIKTITHLDISQRNDLIIFEISAGAFLHHMVRNIVGSLVYVGKGKHPPEWIKQVLESRQRNLAAPTFSAAGLYLKHIQYDKKFSLPQYQSIASSYNCDITSQLR